MFSDSKMTNTIKIIKTKADHAAAMERLGALMDLNPENGTSEAYELDALTALIELYETQQGFFNIEPQETI